jgi:hypothetical protein
MPDTFFTQSTCDRCPNDLKVRTMSWFNDDTICFECAVKETKIKDNLESLGLDMVDYEGCGTVPQFFRNHYTCTNCGFPWNDIGLSEGNDDCSGCGTTNTPEHSDELDNNGSVIQNG